MTAPARDMSGFWWTCPDTGFVIPSSYSRYILENFEAILRLHEKKPLRFHKDRDLIAWCKYRVHKDKVLQLLGADDEK